MRSNRLGCVRPPRSMRRAGTVVSAGLHAASDRNRTNHDSTQKQSRAAGSSRRRLSVDWADMIALAMRPALTTETP